MWEFVVFFGQAAFIFLLFAYSSKQRDRIKVLKESLKETRSTVSRETRERDKLVHLNKQLSDQLEVFMSKDK